MRINFNLNFVIKGRKLAGTEGRKLRKSTSVALLKLESPVSISVASEGRYLQPICACIYFILRQLF